MKKELIKYGGNEVKYQNNLNDLDGTFDDIGQLIFYLRDLSRELVPLTNSLVPLSNNLNDLIENLPSKLEKFFIHNPFDKSCWQMPNVPKTKCCDYEIPIPNNPKDMLPITTLFKNKNEIGKLNEDVLIDIFTEKKVGNVVLDTRKKVLTGWIWGF